MLLLNFYIFKRVSVGMKVLANLEKKVHITELTAVETKEPHQKQFAGKSKFLMLDFGQLSKYCACCLMSAQRKTVWRICKV